MGHRHATNDGDGGPVATPPEGGLRRLGLPITLVAAMVVGTAGQFTAPVLGPLFLAELELGRASLGTLTAILYAVGAVSSPAMGRFADSQSDRRSLTLTFLIGGAGLILLGLAPGYAVLALAMAVAGIASALCNPATNRIVVTQYPPGRRGAVTGVKQSGVQVGALLAGLALPPLALALGWRGALVLSGATLAAGAALVPVTVPSRHQEAAGHAQPVASGPSDTRIVTTLCIFAAFMGLGIAAVTTYLPIYAIESVGASITRAGSISATVGALGIVARLFWGVTADRLRAPIRVLPFLAAGGVTGVALLMLAPRFGTPVLWVGAAILGATAVGWNGVAMLVAMAAVPRARTGWATGRIILAFYGGLVVSPIPFGLVADRTDSYLAGWIAVSLAFFLAGTVVVIRLRERA